MDFYLNWSQLFVTCEHLFFVIKSSNHLQGFILPMTFSLPVMWMGLWLQLYGRSISKTHILDVLKLPAKTSHTIYKLVHKDTLAKLIIKKFYTVLPDFRWILRKNTPRRGPEDYVISQLQIYNPYGLNLSCKGKHQRFALFGFFNSWKPNNMEQKHINYVEN